MNPGTIKNSLTSKPCPFSTIFYCCWLLFSINCCWWICLYLPWIVHRNWCYNHRNSTYYCEYSLFPFWNIHVFSPFIQDLVESLRLFIPYQTILPNWNGFFNYPWVMLYIFYLFFIARPVLYAFALYFLHILFASFCAFYTIIWCYNVFAIKPFLFFLWFCTISSYFLCYMPNIKVPL